MSLSDDEVFEFLGRELGRALPMSRTSPEFLEELQKLPIGLRAMAATYELDVSLTLDDFGWHFGNWHSVALAHETARGLDELGASELATMFGEAFNLAQRFWSELGAEDWSDWYHGSELERLMTPINTRVWLLLKTKRSVV